MGDYDAKPDWAPDWAPDPDSIGYIQKSLATAFLIVAGGYIAYHVLFGSNGVALRTAVGKGAPS